MKKLLFAVLALAGLLALAAPADAGFRLAVGGGTGLARNFISVNVGGFGNPAFVTAGRFGFRRAFVPSLGAGYGLRGASFTSSFTSAAAYGGGVGGAQLVGFDALGRPVFQDAFGNLFVR